MQSAGRGCVVSLEEVTTELGRAAGKADEARGALARAQELATDAVNLITEVMAGASRLDDEFGEVVRHWSEVANKAAELAGEIAAVCERIEEHIRSLVGENPSARQPSWADDNRAQLPTYVTSGFYRDEDGNSDLVQSGREPTGEDQAIARFLVSEGLARPRGTPTVAQHVEVKIGWRMRQSGVQQAELVVNNVVCEGPLSCTELLPDILLPGQTLTVRDPVQSWVFRRREA